MTQEQLLDIPIGKSVNDGAWQILRVTGGWVYCILHLQDNGNLGSSLVMTSSLTSVFVPEPRHVASRFIQLTSNSSGKFYVNIDQVASIYPRQETGATILFAGDNDYYENVKENYDEVMAMIQAIETVK